MAQLRSSGMSAHKTVDGQPAEAPHAKHMLRRTVILPELRVLFLPVPKTACTTVLWLLVDLAGISPERFARSSSAEASPSLTVHDTNLWPPEYRFGAYTEQEREGLLQEPGWLRFSLVRHPATRLWSGWLSKLLLREPRFAETFEDEPWFPGVPSSAEDMVTDFRRFVRGVGAGEASDVHWAVQQQLVEQLPLTHVGHVEQMDETLDLLRSHVGDERWPSEWRDHNRSPLGVPEHAYDSESADVLRRVYADDFAAFEYDDALPAPGSVPTAAWLEQVEAQLPALRATIDERDRLRQLHRVAQRRQRRLEAAERKVERLSSRRVGLSRSPMITNIEGHVDFNVRWAWADGAVEPGFTAVVRVKDEARSLPFSLPPLLRAVERVVLVDNGSIDGTPEVARRVAEEHRASDRLDIFEYPFAIARCGEEHLATPAASVHSLVHFYNWSFSQVRTGYSLKWDGDMVLTDAAVGVLRDLSWQLEAAEVVIKIPRYPLYLVDDQRAFIDLGLRNCEPWGWPNRAGYSFVKALDWELPLWGGLAKALDLPDWSCVELKHLDGDEFGHWSDTNFDASARQERKRREWQVFNALTGAAEPQIEGVQAIEAPPGEHIVDHVRTRWLPQRSLSAAAAQGGRLVSA
jgi:Sulfotransferase family